MREGYCNYCSRDVYLPDDYDCRWWAFFCPQCKTANTIEVGEKPEGSKRANMKERVIVLTWLEVEKSGQTAGIEN